MTQSLKVIQGRVSLPKTKSDWKLLLEEGRKALAKAVEIRVLPACIRPMEGQPRVYFNQDAIMRLADSIRAIGQVQPGIVRKVGENLYELIDGERRWRAITLVGIEYRALLVNITSEAVPFLIAAIANFNREAHTPLEIADAIENMYDNMSMPIEEVAKVLGITVPWTYSMLSLRFLHKDVRALLDPSLPKEQKIPLTAAIQISKMKHDLQVGLAKRVLEKDVSLSGLRKEVVRVSKKEGAYIRTYADEPGKRWKSIGLRVNQLKRMAHDLQGDFNEKDFAKVVSARSGGFSVDEVLTSIQDARRFLDGCEKQLLKAKRGM